MSLEDENPSITPSEEKAEEKNAPKEEKDLVLFNLENSPRVVKSN